MALLRFRRRGGLAGITIATDVPLGELPDPYGKLIRSLVAEADMRMPEDPASPDRFIYEFDIDDGRERRVLRWQEESVPESIRPLIDELTRNSRPVA